MRLALSAFARDGFEAQPADLADRIQAGDRTAESELVRRYSEAVAALIERRLGERGDAEDAFQQTFSIAIQKIRRGEVRNAVRLSGFVCGIARNIAMEFARSPYRARTERITDGPPAREPGPLETLLRRENAEAVRKILTQLSRRDQEVLRRFYLGEEPKNSICERMGLESSHFDQIIFHARQRCRRLFRKAAVKRA